MNYLIRLIWWALGRDPERVRRVLYDTELQMEYLRVFGEGLPILDIRRIARIPPEVGLCTYVCLKTGKVNDEIERELYRIRSEVLKANKRKARAKALYEIAKKGGNKI